MSSRDPATLLVRTQLDPARLSRPGHGALPARSSSADFPGCTPRTAPRAVRRHRGRTPAPEAAPAALPGVGATGSSPTSTPRRRTGSQPRPRRASSRTARGRAVSSAGRRGQRRRRAAPDRGEALAAESLCSGRAAPRRRFLPSPSPRPARAARRSPPASCAAGCCACCLALPPARCSRPSWTRRRARPRAARRAGAARPRQGARDEAREEAMSFAALGLAVSLRSTCWSPSWCRWRSPSPCRGSSRRSTSRPAAGPRCCCSWRCCPRAPACLAGPCPWLLHEPRGGAESPGPLLLALARSGALLVVGRLRWRLPTPVAPRASSGVEGEGRELSGFPFAATRVAVDRRSRRSAASSGRGCCSRAPFSTRSCPGSSTRWSSTSARTPPPGRI